MTPRNVSRETMKPTLLQADARHIPLADGSVHCAVTSPPYWGLRDYGTATWVGGDPDCDHMKGGANGIGKTTLLGGTKTTGHQQEGFTGGVCGKCGAERQDDQLGLEPIPDCLGWATGAPCGVCYVCRMVQVFREVRRVLRADGVCFLNLGDSYAHNGACGGGSPDGPRKPRETDRVKQEKMGYRVPPGLKPKDLVGIPWRVALALQADGWYLRSDIIWHKKAPMPESVTDRPTKAHEYIFLLAKSARYFWDAEAIKEQSTGQTGQAADFRRETKEAIIPGQLSAQHRLDREPTTDNGSRNSRSVWTLGPAPYPGAHFATFPPELPRRCIMAGTSEHGVCPACGAPWEREIEREKHPYRDMEKQRTIAAQQTGRQDGHIPGPGGMVDTTHTTGWRPTCACNAGDPIPATVLDPFAGSGTTLLDARALGRHGIGLDLSADYLQQARQRLDLDRLAAWQGAQPKPPSPTDTANLPLFATDPTP